jgi:SPP1 family predicted phage head-tail adaptor
MDLNLSAKDSSGGFDPSAATTFLETWGAVYTLTGRDLVAAQQQVAEVTHKITIRYAPGVESNQVIFFDDRYYEIQTAQDPDGRKKVLELLCIERNDSRSFDGGGSE